MNKPGGMFNTTIVASVIGGCCTLAAALVPGVWSQLGQPRLEVRAVQPIPQPVTNRTEAEFTTFRVTLHNPGRKAVTLTRLESLPATVKQRELPLAEQVGVASMPHADHLRLTLVEPQAGRPTSVPLEGLRIAPGGSLDVVVWYELPDRRPGVRWLDMTATLTFGGNGVEAQSHPFRVQGFRGQQVQRLAAPSDLRLLR